MRILLDKAVPRGGNMTSERRDERTPSWLTFFTVIYTIGALMLCLPAATSILSAQVDLSAFLGCGVFVALSYGLWTRKTWAWYLWVASHLILVVYTLILMLEGRFYPLLGVIIIIVLILRYANKEEVRRLFHVRRSIFGRF
jgi:hypothetical protein